MIDCDRPKVLHGPDRSDKVVLPGVTVLLPNGTGPELRRFWRFFLDGGLAAF